VNKEVTFLEKLLREVFASGTPNNSDYRLLVM
jgi:hypothetical protein